MNIDKAAVAALIVEQLERDLAVLEQAVSIARDTATHADCLGSSKYETMGLEASYLAQGQGTRLLEVERALAYFRRLGSLEQADASQSEMVALNALVLVEDEDGNARLFWLAAEAGGLKVEYHGLSVTVITARSPLGCALIGKQTGGECTLNAGGRERSYLIRDVV